MMPVQDGVFIDDVILLETLVAKKLEKTAQQVRKEGWKWKASRRECFVGG
jgi:hypothetical protein